MRNHWVRDLFYDVMPTSFYCFSPLNMLDSYENRHGFAFAFGLTVASCIQILFGDYASVIGTKSAKDIAQYPSYLSS